MGDLLTMSPGCSSLVTLTQCQKYGSGFVKEESEVIACEVFRMSLGKSSDFRIHSACSTEDDVSVERSSA